MYKKTITYTDYFGVERTEDFYFNLTTSELMQLQLSTQQGFYNEMQTLIDSHDGPKIMDAFNKIIMQAYGEKSEDGRRFVKSPEISKAFTETPAYDSSLWSLLRIQRQLLSLSTVSFRRIRNSRAMRLLRLSPWLKQKIS